jgi:metal-dependent amidase/aminoacylase/carboxypeptidase family protein
VLLASELVVSLQTIVSREIDPLDPVVVTVGSIHGGTKHNIISDECHLELTVRSYSDAARDHALEAIGRKARAVAAGGRAPEPKVVVTRGTPSLFNDEPLTGRVRKVLTAALGPENVVESPRSMGGEDFSRYGRAGIPIVMFGLGSIAPRRLEILTEGGVEPPSLHSAEYYPDPLDTLRTGMIAMISIAVDQMPAD